MAKKIKRISKLSLDMLRQTRDRTWVINPVCKVIPNKKKEKVKKACRGKVVV